MKDETLKILVVEDDEVDRMAITRALRKAQVAMELVEVDSCSKAIALLMQDHFDCVFLDYRLRDGNGLELVQQIRGMGSKVPLVVLTGQGDEQIAVELMKSGASDYLSKSKVSVNTLPRTLYQVVRVYRAEQEAEQASQRLRESEERYRLILEGSNDGIWDWELESNTVYANDRLLNILGLSTNGVTLNPKLFTRLLHPGDRTKVRKAVIAHLRQQTKLEVEFRIQHSSGEYRYCTARGKAQRDSGNQPWRMSGIVSDITERKRQEQRSQFLAEASTLLSHSLDYQTALENLAQLAIPHLADWCAIDILNANGSFHPIAAAHQDSEKEELIWELQRRFPFPFGGNAGYPKVLRTGKPEICFEVSDSFLQEVAQNAEHLQLLKSLNYHSYICVPLRLGERILGSMLFVWSESRRRYSLGDLNLMEDLAHRAALAIENSRLYRESQDASENLRRAIVILGEQQQQLRTLQHLTNLLNQRLTDLPDLLRVMAQSVCETIAGAQICFITLHNPQCDQMMLTVTTGVGSENLRLEDAFASKEGELRQVLISGKSKLIQPDSDSSDGKGKLPASIYAVAIESSQSGRLGVLAVGNWNNKNAFDTEDRHLLTAVGEQAAIAIDNARLIKTLEDREERLERQNKMLAEQNVELERQREQIQLQNLKLLEAAKLKSEFLGTVSHELRTPMNAIIGFSQLLLRQKNSSLSHQQEEWTNRIFYNGKSLLKLIDDLLDLSKIETGRMDLDPKEFNLVDLVKNTIVALKSYAEEKDLVLNCNCDLERPFVMNDSDRLRQILINLLSNAIKFTEKGRIEVIVQELEGDRLELIVKDTGIGIAQDKRLQIFEAFRQGDQGINRKYPGTGLGLAITDSLVRLMKGEITVDGELGKGSTFRVEFPRYVTMTYQTTSGSSNQTLEDQQTQAQPKKLSRRTRMLY